MINVYEGFKYSIPQTVDLDYHLTQSILQEIFCQSSSGKAVLDNSKFSSNGKFYGSNIS